MKVLIATLLLCLGIYFTTGSGSIIALRSSGSTPLFKALSSISGTVPLLSIGILLIVGIGSVIRRVIGQPKQIAVKGPVTLVIAFIPLATHMAMYNLAYSAGTPQRTYWGPLTITEWFVFGIGWLLFTAGLYLLLRSLGSSAVSAPRA